MRIIYKTENGVSIIIPTGEIDIAEVARKDVPAGVDYWIVEDSDIPSDRTFRLSIIHISEPTRRLSIAYGV